MWKEGNVYGDCVEPAYNAISYTWGRWNLKPQEQLHVGSLKLKGISWSIPRINPEHFSVQDFHHALRVATGEASSEDHSVVDKVEFVWLDVACIDQTDGSLEMAAEIGRQAKIFKGANDVVVWLCRQTSAGIKKWESDLIRSSDLLSEGTIHNELTSANTAGAQEMVKVIQDIRVDPWFSSLWTLQEAFLRQDAVILSKDATTVGENEHGPCPLRLKDLIYFFEVVRSTFMESSSLKQLDVQLKLVSLIEGFGFANFYLEFPMNLLAASQYRETSPDRREDRIYGIMQVFDFRLGKSNPSADPNYHFTVAELEDELGKALLEKYPVMSQMHNHASQPALGKAWRMGHHSTIPRIQQHIFTGTNPAGSGASFGEIKPCARFGTRDIDGNLLGSFSGVTASFHDLLQAIKEQHTLHKSLFSNIYIALDTTAAVTPVMKDWPWNERQCELGTLIDDALPELRILLFGEYNICDKPDNHNGKSVASKTGWSLGLLLLLQEKQNKPIMWHRIGLCIWNFKESDMMVRSNGASESGCVTNKIIQWVYTQGNWG